MSQNEKAPGAGSAPGAMDHDDDDVNRPQHISANTSRSKADNAAERLFSIPVGFLQQLRPGGPWVLTAILPDIIPNEPPIITITARTVAEVDAFVNKHNGRRNLYYSVNPTKTAM
jgi:hypothetical protein